ncbi:MAG TPA: NAD(P)-binding domain-containing protein [Casimicrobiaceae bacterium]|nr:NAD(P)-binding domain-containing protein [Casimicrobiaceae bacterium]
MRTAVATSSLAASSHASGVLTLDAFDQKSEYTQQTGCKSAGNPMEGSNENRSKRLEPLGPGTARILFVGLGTMGLPMATNRVRAGFAVTGFDLDARSVHASFRPAVVAAAMRMPRHRSATCW